MPALTSYQLLKGEDRCELTTDRAAIERLAEKCSVTNADGCLNWTVIETRYNVVRSSVPHEVATVRKLRDYLRSGRHSEKVTRIRPDET
jgi:hypothetical protein